MSVDPNTVVIACLAALGALAFVDGVLIHLVREQLHRRPETRLEHLIHTGRALAFPPILLCFFGGASPALGVVFLAVDQALELADMAIERRSRAYSGGLRSSEYLLHGGALTGGVGGLNVLELLAPAAVLGLALCLAAAFALLPPAPALRAGLREVPQQLAGDRRGLAGHAHARAPQDLLGLRRVGDRGGQERDPEAAILLARGGDETARVAPVGTPG